MGPIRIGAALGLVALLAACGGPAQPASPTGGAVTGIAAGQLTTGKASDQPVDSVTWYGDYRPLLGLDPIKLADYPEETVIPNVCEPMLRVEPDYTVGTGAVAARQQDGTHLLLTLQPNVKFSDGSSVTADDVAFTIQRNMDPAQASNYGYAFSSVKSVTVRSATEVLVEFSAPDYVFPKTLATVAGAIVSKKFVTEKGAAFGAPDVGVLCTGPYKVDSYDGTSKLVMSRNENYWDPEHAAKVRQFTFVFPADPSALANGLTSGQIDGAFNVPTSLLPGLRTATTGTTYVGAEGSTPINVDLLMTSSSGTLADQRVRQALSLALNRDGIAKTVFQGAADPLYRVSGPGTWGYAADTYKASYAALPTAQDVEQAKSLVAAAGAQGKKATFAYPAGDPQSQQIATVTQQTAKSIGLDLEIKGLPNQQYGALFADPSARAGYDAILTKNYIELPEPQLLDTLYGSTGGGTNFSGYSNKTVDDALVAARGTQDDTARAKAVLTAEEQLSKDLPSIPVVTPRATVFLNRKLTGATLTFSYMTSAWAAAIGAT
jgi:peptide/nickel transport system substrate-binding protein